jgi:DNA invertase Pin-like site-specific DNA recombinase
MSRTCFESLLADLEAVLIEQGTLAAREAVIRERIKIATVTTTATVAPYNSQFVERHREELDADQIEFLKAEYRSTADVAKFLETTKTTVTRRISKGVFDAIKPGNEFKICTASVVSTLLEGVKNV